jgi:hypothetical protein
LEKPAGGLRVALVGDSQVEAKEVELDSTFGQVLERGLARRLAGRSVEVLNFGVSGYGTVASLARFRVLGRRLDPDLVLYLFMDNDLHDNLGQDRQLFEVRHGEVALTPISDHAAKRAARRTLDLLKHHTQTYAFLKFRLAELGGGAAHAPVGAAPAPPSDAAVGSEAEWDVLRMAIAAFDAEVRQSGARFLVVQGGTAGAATSARLAKLCDELDVQFWDLRPTLVDVGTALRYRYDGHWRSAGHGAAGEALVGVVARELEATSSGTLSGTDSRSAR